MATKQFVKYSGLSCLISKIQSLVERIQNTKAIVIKTIKQKTYHNKQTYTSTILNEVTT